MDDPDPWSAIAAGWAHHWGHVAAPVRAVLADAAGVRPGSRVLDVGCGTGDLIADLAPRRASVAGTDPAPGMLAVARARFPDADLRPGTAEDLPWPDAVFDVVVAVNAVQFAEDPHAAVREFARVTAPGGRIAVANWAESARNDLDVIEAAVARASDDEPAPDGDLCRPGALEQLFATAGLTGVAAGTVPVPWHVADDDALVQAVLLGADPPTVADLRPAVLAAARPFRTPGGGYRLANTFRYAVGIR